MRPCPKFKRKASGHIIWTRPLDQWLLSVWKTEATVGEIENACGIRHDVFTNRIVNVLGGAPRVFEEGVMPRVERTKCGHVIWTNDLDMWLLATWKKFGVLKKLSRMSGISENAISGRLWRFPEAKGSLEVAARSYKPPGKWAPSQPLWDKPSLDPLPSLTTCLHLSSAEPVVFCDAPTTLRSNYCERHAR